MTFVIKKQVEIHGFAHEDWLFDIEGYNYIIERNSIFTRGDLIKQNYDKLSYILRNFMQIDSVLLESLNYQAAIADNLSDLAKHDFDHHTDKR